MKEMEFLKVEIQELPAWSFLWFKAEETNVWNALIATDSPKMIALLSQLEQKLKMAGQS